MLKRALAGLPALLLLATFSACGDDSGDTETAEDGATTADASADAEGTCTYVSDGSGGDVELPPAEPTVEGQVGADVTSSIGDFTVTLDAESAPCTVNSMVSLIEQGFYDDTPCHRLTVGESFKVLQCGDPTGTGTGGPGYTIPAEYDGSETYPAGTLAMARSQDPDSGGSQFFVAYGNTALPPEYTVFGTIDQDGIDAITKAAEAGVEPQMGPEDGAPKTPIQIESITLQ
ncbi:peptidylprolyl isomerase [Nocardioides sp. BGMRC 2183]|nr:peptidylprolyl isomerase [Nocardioides sp. BGMRC 2183]